MFRLPDRYLPSSLRGKPEKMPFLALAGCIASVGISLAASQILLAAALLASARILKRDRGFLFSMKKTFLPFFIYFLWTVLAAIASPNALRGLRISKKFFLFLIVPLVVLIVRGGKKLPWIHKAVFAVASLSSLLGLAQLIKEPQRDLLHRISGFMGHWMTFSGFLMLALVLLAAYALHAGRRCYAWALPAAACIIAALIASQTRSAWLGAAVGIGILILMRRPRAIAGSAILIATLFFLAPSSIRHRLRSGFDPADPNTRNRIELIQTSVRMIRANPWLGAGPQNVKEVALQYRGRNEFPDWMYMHMHNNFLQIAVGSGIPGLIFWLWMMTRFAWDSIGIYRYARSASFFEGEGLREEASIASSAAFGAWTAFMVAGVFEYNFGDSEVLMLFLFIASAPYAFRQGSANGGAPRPRPRPEAR